LAILGAYFGYFRTYFGKLGGPGSLKYPWGTYIGHNAL